MINPEESLNTKIAARVRHRLERHDVPGDRATWLAATLKLSRAQIFRKLKGSAPWSIEELVKVANAVICPVRELLQDVLATPVSIECEEVQDGILVIEGVLFHCKFRLGQPGIGLSAIQGSNTWRIVSSVRKPPAALDIAELRVISQAKRPRPLVLIIESDRQFAINLCDELEHFGYAAIAISSARGLEDKLQCFDYIDAFIIDWHASKIGGDELLGIATSSRHSHAPIIMLIEGEENAPLLEIVNGFGVHSYSKPISTTLLVTELDSLLNRKPHN